MQQLGNYVQGRWAAESKDGTPLFDAVTGDLIALAGKDALDFPGILEYGRRTGGPSLRKMTFQQRGEMLKKLALFLTKNKEKYYQISYRTGATRIDSWIDIEGGFGNLIPCYSGGCFTDLCFCLAHHVQRVRYSLPDHVVDLRDKPGLHFHHYFTVVCARFYFFTRLIEPFVNGLLDLNGHR